LSHDAFEKEKKKNVLGLRLAHEGNAPDEQVKKLAAPSGEKPPPLTKGMPMTMLSTASLMAMLKTM